MEYGLILCYSICVDNQYKLLAIIFDMWKSQGIIDPDFML